MNANVIAMLVGEMYIRSCKHPLSPQTTKYLIVFDLGPVYIEVALLDKNKTKSDNVNIVQLLPECMLFCV